MTYVPRTYWPERAARQGYTYVSHGTHGSYARHREEFGAWLVSRRPDQWESTLDFGCGPGRFTDVLTPPGGWYVGCDIVPSLHWQVRSSPHVTFAELTADRLPFRDDAFDLVAAIAVLQHIVDPADFDLWTGELWRVMAPGAVALVVDNHYLESPAEHMCPRTPDEVARALGGKVEHVDDLTDHWAAVIRC